MIKTEELNNTKLLKFVKTYMLKLILIFAISVFVLPNANAQKYSEYEVKAAYLYNFIKFIQWPATAFETKDSEFVIGIYGYDPFKNTLKEVLANNTVQNRKLVIKYFKTPDEIKNCHLLFISDVDEEELSIIIKKINKTPVLTVGNNIKNFCLLGGIINFTKQDAKHRFVINNNQAVNANLKISSKLLFLAKTISDDEDKF